MKLSQKLRKSKLKLNLNKLKQLMNRLKQLKLLQHWLTENIDQHWLTESNDDEQLTDIDAPEPREKHSKMKSQIIDVKVATLGLLSNFTVHQTSKHKYRY